MTTYISMNMSLIQQILIFAKVRI